MLRLQTFGEVKLFEEGRGNVPLPQKSLLLLAYMHLEGRARLKRNEVASLLWSESDKSSAQSSLRKMIERVRRAQADGWQLPLSVDSETLCLQTESIVADVDVLTHFNDLEQLQSISALLRQPFLQASASTSFAMWRSQQSNRFFRKAMSILCNCWNGESRSKYAREIVDIAYQLLEQFPDDTKIREILLETQGDRRTKPAARHQEARVAPDSEFDSLNSTTAISLPRLVVLPPVIASATSHQLASALMQDITIGLCALRSVAVVAPYTAEKIRAMSDKAAQLEKHSISYIIDTALSDEGLFAQMIFLPTDSIIWADRFPLSYDHVASRRSIANSIVTAIVNELRRTEADLLDFRTHPEVYRTYLKAAAHLNSLSLPEVRRARTGFKDALRLDRSFAPAYAALARTYSIEWVLTARGDKNLLSSARESAELAIKGNGQLAAAYRELGVAKLYLGDVDESLEALHRAEELSPHFADAIFSYADTLVHASRPAEGLAKIEKAIFLNPVAPDDYFWSAAGASYFLGHFQNAIGFIDRMARPDSAQRLLAASWAMLGDPRKARFHRRKAYELNPLFDLELWLSILPVKEQWQRDLYREGLLKAGF